jgi:signal peptidase I
MTNLKNTNQNLNAITFTLFGSTKDNKVVHENVRTCSWGELKQDLLNEHDVRDGKDGLAITPCGFLPYDHKDVELLDGQICVDGKPIVRRCSSNITDYSMLVIDIDDGNSLEEIIEFFNEYECVITSSHNHMVDEVVKVRVYLPLKQAVNHEEIKKRKNTLPSFFPNPDPSTFAASRVFYLPSVPKERKDKAFIKEFYGELFDVLEFKPDEVEITQKSDDLTDEPLSLQAKSQITQGLKKIGRVEHELFYKIAAGMNASGFTLHDFLDVAPYLKPSYSSRALESQWWYSQKLDHIKTGTLIHILKDLGIKVVGVQKNTRKKIDELNKKIGQVKAKIIPFLDRSDLTEKEEEQRDQNETYYESLLDKKEALLKAENDADNHLNQIKVFG